MQEFKFVIEKPGQEYKDTPVFAYPVKLMTRLHEAMAEVSGHVVYLRAGGKIRRVRKDLPPRILLRVERQYFSWVTQSSKEQ